MSNATQDRDPLLTSLVRGIRKAQYTSSRPFRCVGFYEKTKGLFVSYPTYNVYSLRKYLRRSFAVRTPDNNAFATFWTVDLLLESFGRDPDYLKPIELKDAVTALMEFHDRTRDRDDPLFLFWKQHDLGGTWAAYPANLMPYYRFFMFLHGVRKKLGSLFARRSSGKASHPGGEPRRSSAAMSLPADLDDSSLNWSMGLSLSEHRDAFPEAWAEWSERAFDFKKLARHAVACAYRPFDVDENVNTIDPRTFYAIREFLWRCRTEGKGTPAFSLVTTWASTLRDNVEGLKRYYKMPFNVNNVDYSVAANFMHAAIKSHLSESFPQDVEGFPTLLTNTAEFLAWGIESGAILRDPDLLLLYYPSPHLAFFFVSRTIHLLENASAVGAMADLPGTIRDVLSGTARGAITRHIVSSSLQTDTHASWDGVSLEPEFVFKLRCRNTHDDRAFVTALSLNTIMNLWTVRKEGAVRWQINTPVSVRSLAEKGFSWLKAYVGSGACSRQNAFFSASVKSDKCVPFLFPANTVAHMQGPVLPSQKSGRDRSPKRHSVFGMSGVPGREEYDRMLERTGLLEPAPDIFKQCYELAFPYWTAPSVRNALICLALRRGTEMATS